MSSLHKPLPPDPDDMIDKVRQVAQRITERVRKTAEDTGLDLQALSTEQTKPDGELVPPDQSPAG